MDKDPAVEPELDTFSRILPLPYRIAVILVLGVWAWGVNLHYLSVIKIDAAALVKYHARTPSNIHPHYRRTYKLATAITLPLAVSILLFWVITHGQPSLVLAWDILPQSFLFLLAIFFLLPFQRLSRTGRYRFLSTLKRVSIGGIAEANNGKFGDILLADVLTSYAKVLGDMFVSACMFLSPGVSSTGKPDRNCGGAYVVPLIISIPSMIRLRQCLIEYLRVRNNPNKDAVTGWGGQHLANALKYSSAFPVIVLSALQRGTDPKSIGLSEAGLFRLWLFFVFTNSFYSFYWDVAKDWDLTLFAPSSVRNNPDHPWGLRRHTHFHTSEIYYSAILIDLMLRCTWSFKLSPHLDHFNDLEGSIFIMELLEVLRRWLWIFFRVETEWGKSLCELSRIVKNAKATAVRTNRGPPVEDILLGDMNESPVSLSFPK
ncbi:EXS family-domain-containing protein [Usnea florida]